VDEPHRTFGGEIGKHRCFRCGRSSKWTRDVDSRSVKVEQVPGGVLITDVTTPADLDPPLLPTIYRCGRPDCGHEHSTLPEPT
jgi:hypothetical protein